MDRFAALQRELKEEVDIFQNVQQDIAKNHSTRQQFLQQQHENEMVSKELDLCEDDDAIYKLIGPALIKQDPEEAKSNVAKRLEFIASEITRLDDKLKSLEDKRGRKQNQIVRLQQEVQAFQQRFQQQEAVSAA